MTHLKALAPLRHSTPKYLEIAERVRAQIHGGTYQPGEKLPRVADLKQEWKISLGTLDRVLKVLETDGLIERTQGSGIYVARNPRRETRELTGVVGVLGLNHDGELNSYWNHLLMGAQKAAREAGLHLMLMDDTAPQWERIDGVLAMSYGAEENLRQRPEPMRAVSLLARWDHTDAIVNDDGAGVTALMEHLLGLGHSHVAYLHTPGADDGERLTAYRRALGDAGIAVDARWSRPLYKDGEFSRKLNFSGHAFKAMQRWLREDWRELGCSALLAHNDEAAVGALKALRAANIAVPDEVSVVGFDGTELAAHTNPALTTWLVPLEEIGARGLQKLQSLMQDESDAPNELPLAVKGQLIVGDSTAPPSNRV